MPCFHDAPRVSVSTATWNAIVVASSPENVVALSPLWDALCKYFNKFKIMAILFLDAGDHTTTKNKMSTKECAAALRVNARHHNLSNKNEIRRRHDTWNHSHSFVEISTTLHPSAIFRGARRAFWNGLVLFAKLIAFYLNELSFRFASCVFFCLGLNLGAIIGRVVLSFTSSYTSFYLYYILFKKKLFYHIVNSIIVGFIFHMLN